MKREQRVAFYGTVGQRVIVPRRDISEADISSRTFKEDKIQIVFKIIQKPLSLLQQLQFPIVMSLRDPSILSHPYPIHPPIHLFANEFS